MMRRAALIAVVLPILVGPHSASAGDETQLALAGKLLEAMQMQKTIEDQYAIMRHMQAGVAGEMTEEFGVPPDVAKTIEPLQEEIADLLERELSWEATKSEYAQIYASTFTADEMAGLIAFYESPVGQALLLKTPDLTVKTMEVMQHHMAAVRPQMQELIRRHTEKARKTQTPSECKAEQKAPLDARKDARQ
jgi:uncharacterized protein